MTTSSDPSHHDTCERLAARKLSLQSLRKNDEVNLTDFESAASASSATSATDAVNLPFRNFRFKSSLNVEGDSRMKWFKHMSDAYEDEALSNLVSKHGLLIYARWWRILETIAKQMDESDKAEVTYCKSVWAHILVTKPSDVAHIMATFSSCSLLVAVTTGDLVKVECQNLLKIRARSKPYREQKKHLEVEVDTEVEVDKENGSAKALPDKRVSFLRDSWLEAYKNSYAVEYRWSAKEAKLAKGLLAYLDRNSNGRDSVEAAKSLFQNYLAISDDKYLTTARHDFALMASRPHKYLTTQNVIQWPTGPKEVTV